VGSVGLGYRRQQIVQDITEEQSPKNTAGKQVPKQKQLLNQNSNTSLQSQKQPATQVVDLTNLFYGNIAS